MRTVNVTLQRFDNLIKVDLKCACGILSQFNSTWALSERLKRYGAKAWEKKHGESFIASEVFPTGRWISPLRAELETVLNTNEDLNYEMNEVLDYIS